MIYTIYGRPKIGKTEMSLKDAPRGKTAILSADEGLIGIDTSGFTVVEDLSARKLVKTLTPAFVAKHDRFVVDTATSLYGLLLTEAAGGMGTPRKQDYGTATAVLGSVLRTLKSSKKEVVVLAQEKIFMPGQGLGADGKEEWQPEDEDEDQTALTTVDLSPAANSMLLQMSDVIGRLYIANVDDKPVRRLWLGPSSSIVAGARSKTYRGNPPYLKSPSITRLNTLLGWTRQPRTPRSTTK